MKAVRAVGGAAAVVEVDPPIPGPLEVLLEVRSAGICGTDLGMLAAPMAPVTFGHEFAGIHAGEAYAVEPTHGCGSCAACTAGHSQRCRVNGYRTIGLAVDGGMAEHAVVPRANLVALPAGLGPHHGCLVEPLAVAMHGVHRSGVVAGERVAVVGGGSLGLLAVAALRARGHEVDLDARHAHQRAAGERLGARIRTSGEYDVVVETAGSASGLVRCADLAADGGRVVLLGVFPGALGFPGIPMLVKELTLVASMAYRNHAHGGEFGPAVTLLAADPEIAAALVTHRFPLADAAMAFAVAADRGGGAIKVVLEP